MDSGDNSSQSDKSISDTGSETSTATTSICAVSPDVSNSNEGKMMNTMIDGEDGGGFVITALGS